MKRSSKNRNKVNRLAKKNDDARLLELLKQHPSMDQIDPEVAILIGANLWNSMEEILSYLQEEAQMPCTPKIGRRKSPCRRKILRLQNLCCSWNDFSVFNKNRRSQEPLESFDADCSWLANTQYPSILLWLIEVRRELQRRSDRRRHLLENSFTELPGIPSL